MDSEEFGDILIEQKWTMWQCFLCAWQTITTVGYGVVSTLHELPSECRKTWRLMGCCRQVYPRGALANAASCTACVLSLIVDCLGTGAAVCIASIFSRTRNAFVEVPLLLKLGWSHCAQECRLPTGIFFAKMANASNKASSILHSSVAVITPAGTHCQLGGHTGNTSAGLMFPTA